MNQFIILVLLLVIFCYCGDKYCPTILKHNRQILLGVVYGLVLSSLIGIKLEAFTEESCDSHRDYICKSGTGQEREYFNHICSQYGLTC